MKALLPAAVAFFATLVCRGASADEAIVSAMKLSEQPNYSWSATVADDVRTYDVAGKTIRGAGTWLRLPMVKSIAERLGRDAGTDIEAIFKRSDVFVIHTPEGWKTLPELPRRHPDFGDSDVWVLNFPGTSGGLPSGLGSLRDPFDDTGMWASLLHRVPAGETERGYSNAQFALSRPHEDLAVIVSSHTEMKVEGDHVSGSLSDIGAQLLLVHAGQDHIEPLAAEGMFELIIRDGLVRRYRLRLEGILLIGKKRILVRQTSETVITNVGATRFELPEEARRKLGE